MIYLDNAATTPLRKEVADRIRSGDLLDIYANPSSVHREGKAAREVVEAARANVMKTLHASKGTVIFTSGGTESNNLAIRGIYDYLSLKGKNKILKSAVEHPSVRNPLKTKPLPVDPDCKLDINELRKRLQTDKEIGLVSVQAVNNEVGAVQNIEEIGNLCHEYGVRFHTDAVQAVGHIDIDVEKCDIDMLSLSGHKFGAPKGIGALYVRNEKLLTPILYGGGQEFGIRSGTENVPGIIGLDTALNSIDMESENKYIKDLRTVFLDSLKNKMKIPYRINCPDKYSHIVSVTIPHVEASLLVFQTSDRGLCISSGSACHSSSLSPSTVLTSMGMPTDEAVCTIRISFAWHNTRQDSIKAAEIISSCADEIYTTWQGVICHEWYDRR